MSLDEQPSLVRRAGTLRPEREERDRRHGNRSRGPSEPVHLSSEGGRFDYVDEVRDIHRIRRVQPPSEHGNLDVYMRGARSERGSDESDGGDRIKIVRN